MATLTVPSKATIGAFSTEVATDMVADAGSYEGLTVINR